MRVSGRFAGPFVGEFGHELFCWQGALRAMAHDEPITVACRSGFEMLYRDFALEIVSHDIRTPDAYRAGCPGYVCPGFDKTFFSQPIEYDHLGCVDYRDGLRLAYGSQKRGKPHWLQPWKTELVPYDWRRIKRLPPQEFVPLGNFAEGIGCDVLLHARNRTASDERNYQQWAELLRLLDGLDVASIGGSEAELIDGTTDLRRLPLDRLCDTMASSFVIAGPSSGPIHLAALALCPAVTWFGRPYDARNRRRFLEPYPSGWNPFGVPVRLLDGWQPEPQQVAAEIFAALA